MDDFETTRKLEIERFTRACVLFLDQLCIGDLRAYGRDLGVARPTVMSKEELTDAIIGILTGRLLPVEISRQGAPVKNDYVDKRIPEKIEALRRSFMPGVFEQMEQRYRMEQAEKNKPVFFLRSPEGEEEDAMDALLRKKPDTKWDISPFEIYRGQVEFVDGDYYIYPLSGSDEHVVSVSVELIKGKQVREGDVVSYRAFRNSILGGCATEILTVNSSFAATLPVRVNFDESIGFCSTERLQVYKGKRFDTSASKFIDWLQPICMGQRGCIIAPPKTGKSTFLCDVAAAMQGLHEGMTTFVLLINQPMEVVYAYSSYVPEENLFFTTYGEDAERHIFAAEFVLKRMKRMAENGENVFLVVDSLSELARAFNETDASVGGEMLACGLEQKTLEYVKGYFDTAKYLVRGGSITMLASINAETGDPVDDLLAKELCTIANYKITLADGLAKKRIYPAIDYRACEVERLEKVLTKSELALATLLKKGLIEKIGDEGLITILQDSNSRREFVKKMEEAYYEN